MAAPIYILSKCTHILGSPHPSYHFLSVCVCVLRITIDRHETVSYCDADLHPPDD